MGNRDLSTASQIIEKLKKEIDNAAILATERAATSCQVRISASELKGYQDGKKDATLLEGRYKSVISNYRLDKAVVNGECEAFGRGNNIDVAYPVNTKVTVNEWCIKPDTLELSSVVASSQKLLEKKDYPITSIKCGIGKADITASYKDPVLGKDGQHRPVDEEGNIIETNKYLK